MTQRITSTTLASLFLLALAPAASAWNGTAHEVIALIAWDDLNPQARQKVESLLTSHPDYADMLTKPATRADDLPREAFLTASAWPDLVPSGGKSFRYNHSTWHYVDLPFTLGIDPRAIPDLKWDPQKDPANAAQAWAKCLADLSDAKLPDADRAIALCWIEHLAGDIHQPLHATSLFTPRLPNGDQGGNLVMIKNGDKLTNLHTLWDGLLGDDESFANISKSAAHLRDLHPRKEFDSELKATDFKRWAESSNERAKVVVYQEGTLPFLTRDEMNQDKSKPVPELPAGYLDKAHQTAESCAALAGYRLADRLNQSLGK